MHSKTRGWAILALFFCSGATALVYEVVWSKFLSQMFGSTVYAQTVVLAVFMGGLALGNRIFGRWADGMQEPVRAYGILEIAIGVYALVFPALDRLADTVFVAIGSGLAEKSTLLLALKGILAAALLLFPTILMGGTLPLLAAWLQRFHDDAGRRSARFYSVNSLGAVAGSGLAGFWLIYNYGLISTLYLTAAANVLIGVAAMVLGRSPTPAAQANHVEPPPSSGPESASSTTLRWAGLIVALTGGASMGLEVVSARSMALIFGSSIQSFAIVLMAFILGIGLGSAWIASLRHTGKSSERLIVLLLCAAAVWVVILVFNIERWVDFYRVARTGLSRTGSGYVYHLLLNSGIALVILGVPAACIGAVLPLMIRAISHQGATLGRRVGALLTWNTLGAVGGVLFTGFVLMPAVGLRSTFAILALTLAVVAFLVALGRGWRVGLTIPATGMLLACGLFVFGNEGWRHVMSSGVFRIWEKEFDPRFMEVRKEHMKILFYEDAPDATVTVEKVDGHVAKAGLGLRINGKPDASTYLDMGTQLLTAHLPMLAKPDAKDVFVLGLGSGITAGTALAYPVDQVVVAENCEPVVRAARFFDGWNREVLDSPRAKIWVEDARTVLKLSPQEYDVIVTVPSNPWTAGIGAVFSKEYYELAARRLKPGGIVAQWFQIYETQDEIVELVLRTFSSVFPHVEIWDSGGDIIMLGGLEPWPTGPDVWRKGFEIERVKTDMWMIDVQSPEALLVKQLASQRTGFAIAGEGRIQTDGHPILGYAAPRAFYIGSGTRMLDKYDERTWMQLLGPTWKRNVLAGLPPSDSQMILSTFSTINGELHGAVFGTNPDKPVPCVFRTPHPVPAPASDGSVLSHAMRAFAAGQIEQADQLVSIAEQSNPDSIHVRFMKRVVEREKELISLQQLSAQAASK